MTAVPARRTALACAVLLAVLACGWLALRAGQARSALLAARAVLLPAATAGADAGRLEQAQVQASAELRRARAAVDDPVWRAAGAVPVLGRSFGGVRAVTLAGQDVVDGALPPLLAGLRRAEDGVLQGGGTVDLGVLRALGADVDRAAAAAARADRRPLPVRGVPAPVAGPARELDAQLQRLATGLAQGRDALAVLPRALGEDGPRRWFLAVQNNAEARGTGGLVGAYAVVRADRGRFALDAVGTNGDFRTAEAPVVELGPEFSARYDRLAGRRYWSSAVLTPDWPSAAQVMAGLWQAQGGGRVDGVLGIDPVAMAHLLRVTGPTEAAGRRIGADDIVDFVMRDEYVEFAEGSRERKEALTGLAAGLYARVAGGGYSATGMGAALARAAGSGHLQVWSAHPGEQAVLAPLRVAGALPGTPGAYLQVVNNNAAGNKADYYVRRAVRYQRTAPGAAEVTVELRNTVDAAAVPPIVTGRVGPLPPDAEPGQTRVEVSVFVGAGEQVTRLLVDGTEVSADLGTERGHGVGTVLVEVRPSRPTVVVAEVTDPGGVLTYRQQPLVVDDALDLRVPHRTD